jgi:hypothetical protein
MWATNGIRNMDGVRTNTTQMTASTASITERSIILVRR